MNTTFRSWAKNNVMVNTNKGPGVLLALLSNMNWKDPNKFEVRILETGKKHWLKREEILSAKDGRSSEETIRQYMDKIR